MTPHEQSGTKHVKWLLSGTMSVAIIFVVFVAAGLLDQGTPPLVTSDSGAPGGYPAMPDDYAATPEPTLPRPPGSANPAIEEIVEKFHLPFDACVVIDPYSEHVLAAMQCTFGTDMDGVELASPITVIYTKWASQSDMDDYFDWALDYQGAEETPWFVESSDESEGRLIELQYDEEHRILGWTWNAHLLSGEAISAGTQETLRNWWTNSSGMY